MNDLNQPPEPQVAPTTLGVTIENAMLRSESRIQEKFQSELKLLSNDIKGQLNSQNETYLNKLMGHEQRITTNTNDIKSLKARLWASSAACTALGGLLGFFISMLTK